jgi:hypothetical protein
MPNDFHPEFQIDNDGHIVPAGPLELEPGEQVTDLFAWVIQTNQDGTSAMCAGFQDTFPNPKEWIAQGGAYNAGRFRAGLAHAMAVMVTSGSSHYGLGGSPNDPRVYWWSETVVLKNA